MPNRWKKPVSGFDRWITSAVPVRSTHSRRNDVELTLRSADRGAQPGEQEVGGLGLGA